MFFRYVLTGSLILLSACQNSKHQAGSNEGDSFSMVKQSENLEIYKIHNLEDLDKLLDNELKSCSADDIAVVFDFNYTLMYPLEPSLHKVNIEYHKKKFKELISNLPSDDRDILIGKSMLTERQVLVSQHAPKLIDTYSKKGVNFLVCSSSLSSLRSAEMYYRLLKSNGIAIRNNYNLPVYMEFTRFKKYIGGYPIYNNAIITTNKEKKGEVLKNLFAMIPSPPKTVIFVDNNAEKISNVAKMTEAFPGMKLVLIEYSEYIQKNISSVSQQEFVQFWEKKLTNE